MRVLRSVNNFARKLYTRGHDAHAHHEVSFSVFSSRSRKDDIHDLISCSIRYCGPFALSLLDTNDQLVALNNGPPSKKAALIFLGSLTVVPTVLTSLWYITYVGNPFTRVAQKKE
nr:unnamed protein product [Naegleria fowleri]